MTLSGAVAFRVVPTVSLRVAVMLAMLAACVAPVPMAVHSPLLAELSILAATVGLSETQAASLVLSFWPSVQVPIALSCKVEVCNEVGAAMNAGEGEITSVCKTAAVMVRGRVLLFVVVLLRVREAWILIGPPTDMPRARPAPLMEATALLVEVHVAAAVTSTGVPEKSAIAVYCSGRPLAMVLSGEVMVIEVNAELGTTSTTALAVAKGPLIAVMVTVPVLFGLTVTIPVLGSTLATVGSEEYHLAETVMARLGA